MAFLSPGRAKYLILMWLRRTEREKLCECGWSPRGRSRLCSKGNLGNGSGKRRGIVKKLLAYWQGDQRAWGLAWSEQNTGSPLTRYLSSAKNAEPGSLEPCRSHRSREPAGPGGGCDPPADTGLWAHEEEAKGVSKINRSLFLKLRDLAIFFFFVFFPKRCRLQGPGRRSTRSPLWYWLDFKMLYEGSHGRPRGKLESSAYRKFSGLKTL